MSDTFFIIFFILLIVANVAFFIYWGVSEKWRNDKNHLRDFLKGCDDMKYELDRFMKDAEKIPGNIVTDLTPVIDCYIKERVEEYLRANAETAPSVSDIQEADITRCSADNAKSDVIPVGKEGAYADVSIASDVSFEDIEAAMRNVYFSESYKDTFLREPEKTFRASTGKQVNIRLEYHRSILQLLGAAGSDCSTLTGFLDNVLKDHFKIYGRDIEGIIKSRYVNTESL